jgi:hypothetical protein
MWTPDYKATLAYFDQREQEIERTLAHLQRTLSLKEYQRIAKKFAREKRQIAVRRRFIQAIMPTSSD